MASCSDWEETEEREQQWRAAESEMGAAQTAKTRSVDVMLMVVADAQESYAII